MPTKHKKNRLLSKKTKERLEFYFLLTQLVFLLVQIFSLIGA